MKKTIFYFLIFFPLFSYAQQFTGKVFIAGDRGRLEPAAAAAVFWAPETPGGTVKEVVYTDENGGFRIAAGKSHLLVAAYMGFAPDTIHVHEPSHNIEFILHEDAGALETVHILGRQKGNLISKFTPIKTEVITAAGLCKMACCNLAESFENSASVTVGYADAVTGARQIRLLGLSGNYTQMLEENRPAMRGVQVPFGFSFVPGQWLESIQIAKGTGSVVNGTRTVTGQINMEYRKTHCPVAVLSKLVFERRVTYRGKHRLGSATERPLEYDYFGTRVGRLVAARWQQRWVFRRTADQSLSAGQQVVV